MAMYSIADDYEDLAMVIEEVSERFYQQQNIRLNRDDIVKALLSILDKGMAQAYHLVASFEPPRPLEGELSVTTLDKCHFLLTKLGHAEIAKHGYLDL